MVRWPWILRSPIKGGVPCEHSASACCQCLVPSGHVVLKFKGLSNQRDSWDGHNHNRPGAKDEMFTT